MKPLELRFEPSILFMELVVCQLELAIFFEQFLDARRCLVDQGLERLEPGRDRSAHVRILTPIFPKALRAWAMAASTSSSRKVRSWRENLRRRVKLFLPDGMPLP